MCILLIFLTVTLMKLRALGKISPDRVCRGVSAGGTDLSGMTLSQAVNEIQTASEALSRQEITLKVEGAEVKVQLFELGFSVRSVKKLAGEAVDYGKKGNIWKRYREVKAAEKKGKDFQPEYILEKKTAETVLKEKCLPLSQTAQNAQIHREGEGFVITEEKAGHTIDVQKTQKAVEEFLNRKWKKKGGSVTAVSVPEEPEVTKEQLAAIDAELGSFTTYCGSGGGRVQNIETGSARISGSVILPGKEFSADAAMRPYTDENGYTEAGSYENGTVVQSMGGGICQISTTLYNAVLYAELEVTRRQPHSMLVDYVSPSRDAAIADDVKDFQFRNTTEAPVYIECSVENEQLTIRIYGKESRPEGRTVDYESEVLETVERETQYRACDEAVGYMETTSYGHTGKSARLWKVVCENGQETSREVINESYYAMSPDIVSVGTASDNPDAAAEVKAAIAAQDGAAIEAAVARASQMEAGQADTDTADTEYPDAE